MHLLNVLAGHTCTTRLWLHGEPLFGGRPVHLPSRTGLMLPLDLRLPAATVAWSTAEITGTGPDRVSFAARDAGETICLRTGRTVVPDGPCDVHRDGDVVTVTATRPGPLTLTTGPPPR